MGGLGPLAVGCDGTLVLLHTEPLAAEAEASVRPFAVPDKSLDTVTTFTLTPISLWNGLAAGLTPDEMLARLERFARYGLPAPVYESVVQAGESFGRVRLTRRDDLLVLEGAADDLAKLTASEQAAPYLTSQPDGALAVDPAARGQVKLAALALGLPVNDLAGYREGAPLSLSLRLVTLGGLPFELRDYQRQAARAFVQAEAAGGSGLITLPCGSGKTVVGLAVLAELQREALVLCPSVEAVDQWIGELIDKTTLTSDQVGRYTGDSREVRPVTVATYQMLIQDVEDEAGGRVHLRRLGGHDWGLIIYDEAHLLPAPVFRLTAELQARRRLALTATLVREDGREGEVFCLIGPRLYDLPWRELERRGYIAPAECYEVRVGWELAERVAYAAAPDAERPRLAAENPYKDDLAADLVKRHAGDQVLVLGQYLAQLNRLAARLKAPLITGDTPHAERGLLYARFRAGELPCLVASRVANLAIDLPEANVAVQVSGTYGSRQEEAQRLGRLLRPKAAGGSAVFYTLVTRDTVEQRYALRRQGFLVGQGYRYTVVDSLAELDVSAAPAARERA